jgi:thiol-disulfide isomerase/thioredoxin
MKKFLILIILFCGCLAMSQGRPPIPIKVYAKEGVSVKAYDYEKLAYFLNQKNDTTYVVNFWATWCVPCVKELPHFEKLNQQYKGKKVKVLLVSLDMAKMVESKLLPFIKKKNLRSDVVLLRDPDSNNWIPKIDKSWSGAIPATLIYNKKKRKFYEKSFEYNELEKAVNEVRNAK